MDSSNKLNVGKDSVVIGNVTGNIGNGSVVIGATDAYGNTIINTSMAVGKNAYASPGSIAIGAGAMAGNPLDITLHQLNEIIASSNDLELKQRFSSFLTEVNTPEKNKSILMSLWNIIKISATLDGARSLTEKVSEWISSLS